VASLTIKLSEEPRIKGFILLTSLMSRLGREHKNLEPVEEFILFQGLMGVLAILPFAVWRFWSGNIEQGMVDLLIVVFMVVIGAYVFATGRYRLAGIIFTMTYSLGMVLSVYVRGTELLFWAYPVTLACYFTVRLKEATAISLMCLALVTWLIRDIVEPSEMLRFVVTYVLVATFAFIFARRVHHDRVRLSVAATVDSLTGAGNRRAMDDEIESVVSSFSRRSMPVSLVLFDIDHFKRINDNHGHGVGDQFLQRFVEFMQVLLRRNEKLFRLGGEEFVVIVEGDVQEAQNLADQIRHLLEKTRLIPGLSVTVSVGVAQLREKEDSRDWMKRADDALYRAKHYGRNQVCSATTN
jgi:diguanylate cyclase (GGDEF)-like protein